MRGRRRWAAPWAAWVLAGAAVALQGCGTPPWRSQGPTGAVEEQRIPITSQGRSRTWPRAPQPQTNEWVDHTIAQGPVGVDRWGTAHPPPDRGLPDHIRRQQAQMDPHSFGGGAGWTPREEARASAAFARDQRRGTGAEACWGALARLRTWEVRPGEEVGDTLKRWIKEGASGWTVERRTRRTWVAEVGARWEMSLDRALEEMVGAWGRHTQPSPTLRAWGNCVLVLSDNETRR